MHRRFEQMLTPGRNQVLITGSFTTDGAGAVESQVDPAGAFEVTKPAGTGIYRITLGSVANPDRVPQVMHPGFVTVEKTTATPYVPQFKVATLTTAATPYLDILVKSEATSGTEYSASMLLAGLYPHKAAAAGIATANASDLATSKTLAKAIADYLAAHDDSAAVHTIADAGALACAAYASTPAEPANLAEVNAMVLEMTQDWNTHAAKTAVHPGTDLLAPTLLVLNPGAADQAANNRALNALKAAVNQSVTAGAAPTTAYVKSVAAADALSTTFHFGFIVSNCDTNAT